MTTLTTASPLVPDRQRRATIAAALLAVTGLAGLGGCDLLHAATAGKLDASQRDALADLFTETGAIASVIADPTTATSADLADALVLDHFVRLTGADAATARRATRRAPAAVPACIVSEGSMVTATDCAVPVGALTCRVDGHATGVAEGSARRYAGHVAMTGEGCPQRAVDFDFLLSGPSGAPTALDGGLDFSENHPPGDVYSGHLTFDGIGLASGCDQPSTGRLSVMVSGTFGGAPVDDAITISFNATPECGVILIED